MTPAPPVTARFDGRAALRPGGLLISDDIGDNQAWRTFCAQIGRETIVVRTGSKHLGIVVKAR